MISNKIVHFKTGNGENDKRLYKSVGQLDCIKSTKRIVIESGSVNVSDKSTVVW